MEVQSYKKLELDKILSACAAYAVLDSSKRALTSLLPSGDLSEVRERLKLTEECDKLLFTYGVGKVEHFDDVADLITRASKGSTLSCKELTEVNRLLISARAAYRSVNAIEDEQITLMKQIAARVYFDENLETDISEKIIGGE